MGGAANGLGLGAEVVPDVQGVNSTTFPSSALLITFFLGDLTKIDYGK